MNLIYGFLIVSIIIWFLPLFKQKNTSYWNYFLVLAASDPLILIIRTSIKINSSYLNLFFLVFMISTLQKKENFIYSIVTGIIFTASIGLLYYQTYFINIMVMVYVLILICLVVLKMTTYLKNNTLNLFLSLVLLYNIIHLFKFLAVLLNKELGIVSFYLGYLFQIIFGILFTFININTKNFKLNLTFFEKRAE